MQQLAYRILHYPVVAQAAMYLGETMHRADGSVGAALVFVIGGLLASTHRTLTQDACRRRRPFSPTGQHSGSRNELAQPK
ncbi:MAG: hypothetical protein ABSF50_02255 [Burkholderiaceae bacterium]|jgi:hypothetical protein